VIYTPHAPCMAPRSESQASPGQWSLALAAGRGSIGCFKRLDPKDLSYRSWFCMGLIWLSEKPWATPEVFHIYFGFDKKKLVSWCEHEGSLHMVVKPMFRVIPIKQVHSLSFFCGGWGRKMMVICFSFNSPLHGLWQPYYILLSFIIQNLFLVLEPRPILNHDV